MSSCPHQQSSQHPLEMKMNRYDFYRPQHLLPKNPPQHLLASPPQLHQRQKQKQCAPLEVQSKQDKSNKSGWTTAWRRELNKESMALMLVDPRSRSTQTRKRNERFLALVNRQWKIVCPSMNRLTDPAFGCGKAKANAPQHAARAVTHNTADILHLHHVKVVDLLCKYRASRLQLSSLCRRCPFPLCR